MRSLLERVRQRYVTELVSIARNLARVVGWSWGGNPAAYFARPLEWLTQRISLLCNARTPLLAHLLEQFKVAQLADAADLDFAVVPFAQAVQRA